MIFYRLKHNLPDWTPFWLDSIIFTIDNISWSLVHRFVPRYKYHIVRTGLKPNYYDVDTLMEASLVALLNRYVEDEQEGEFRFVEHIHNLRSDMNDMNLDQMDYPYFFKNLQEQIKSEEQILSLYRWFKYVKPKMEQDLNEKTTEYSDKVMCFFKNIEWVDFADQPELKRLMSECSELEENIYKFTTDRLKEIIDLRGSMWT